jgi:hypothetical protein
MTNRFSSRSGRSSVRCPICSAPAGLPCRNKQGEVLSGLHFQRLTTQRSAVRAALAFYMPLNISRKERFNG